MPLIGQFRAAIKALNPDAVNAAAERPIAFGVLAADDDCVAAMQEFLRPDEQRGFPGEVIRITSDRDFDRVTAGFAERGIPHPRHFYSFDRADPDSSAASLLDDCESDWIPLARNFSGFRSAVSDRFIWKIARENALCTVASSLPNVVPSALILPWAVGEFASDTLFLTVNQVRLSFLLAAAHGHSVGFDSQSIKIGSIAGAAFGWRAIARQAVSKVPAGIGLVPKGLIALAGTYAVGRGLEHWHREGTILGSAARLRHFEDARVKGRDAVERIVRSVLSPSSPAARPA